MTRKKVQFKQKYKTHECTCDKAGLIKALEKSETKAYVVEQCRYTDGSSYLRIEISEAEE